jgi:hypothetical protein
VIVFTTVLLLIQMLLACFIFIYFVNQCYVEFVRVGRKV